MKDENKNLFDEMSEVENKNVLEEIDALETEDGDDGENLYVDPETVKSTGADFEFGGLSDKEKKEVILKDEDKDRVFTIEKVELGLPMTRDLEGNLIPPKPFSDQGDQTKKGYKSKLKITYADSNYISMIPSVKWYLGRVNPQTGKQTLNPWFNFNIGADDLADTFTAEISKLYYKFCIKFGYEPGKLTQQQFIKELEGKKVKLKQYTTKYNKETAYRLDISEFV